MAPQPRKRFGQNFLVDRHAVERIVDALAPRDGSAVLEIGPGTGALTSPLIRSAGRIAAVEVDRDLAADLRRRFGEDRLVLLEDDIRQVELESVRAALGVSGSTGLLVAGNLPYNLSKPIAMKLIDQRAAVDRAVLMFQREVADRIVATPGGRDYGPLSVLAGLTYRVERLFDLSPEVFRPRPKVTSTVTRWARRPLDTLPRSTEERLRICLRASFAHRRRTLRNNLRFALGDRAEAVLEASGIDGGLRPETLDSAAFLRLAATWPDASL